MWKGKATSIILVLVLIAGIGILSYPYVSSYLNSKSQSMIISDYNKSVQTADKQKISQALSQADDYNQHIATSYPNLAFANLHEQKSDKYNSLKTSFGGNVLAYIVIPAINAKLPVYFGTEDKELNKGVGHYVGTSLPVGGNSTHSVLMGHTGLPSSDLFNDIDRLKIGDKFYIHVLDKKLAYEVDDISVVLPSELDGLDVVQNKDLISLVTCTPYSINTHRLIVRGHRVEYDESNDDSLVNSVIEDNTVDIWIVVGLITCAIIIVIVCLRIKIRKKVK